MKGTLLAAASAAILLLAIVLLVVGCSGESSVGPAVSRVSQVAIAAAISEPIFVETFDKHSNVEGWSFVGNRHNRIEFIEAKGGNPGWFLHATCGKFGCLDSAAPLLRTEIGNESIFTGDYRSRKVAKIGVDIAIFGAANTGGRPLSVMLSNDGGTPYDYTDDIWVFWKGYKLIPMPNGVFKEFDFVIPSQSTTLPDGWKVMYSYSTGDVDLDWNIVMNEVSQVYFHFGDPEMFFMFQTWDIGVDNVRLWYDE